MLDLELAEAEGGMGGIAWRILAAVVWDIPAPGAPKLILGVAFCVARRSRRQWRRGRFAVMA